jgi:long-chain acyl-CoA synthetase
VRSKYDLSSLRAVTHAGAGCPVDVKHRMMAWFGPVLYEYYAASEGYGTSITPEQWLAHPGSVGHISSDGAEIVIVDENDRELPPGEVGTVYIRLPGVGDSEYLGDPEKTAASRRAGGFRTFGDMGYIDGGGWLYLVDRRADMILSGGVNIYPAEVEQRLRSHPWVSDVCVVGVPDAEWGQRVLAVVVPTREARPGEMQSELVRHCEVGLARFKCPRDYEVRDELPYSAAGKLLRRVVRDAYWN